MERICGKKANGIALKILYLLRHNRFKDIPENR